MTFAANTSVAVHKSQAEIGALLDRMGATKKFTIEESGQARVGFELGPHNILFTLDLPRRELFATRKVRGRTVAATPSQQQTAYEQACRTAWRGLLLVLKAKITALEGGIETFEQSFLAHFVVGPNDLTLFKRLQQLRAPDGRFLLPGAGGTTGS